MAELWTQKGKQLAKLRRFAGIVFVGVLLAACSSDGDLDNPVSRRFILFNYLDGQDIRQGCGPGTPQTYRFVYVAQREFQVRAYDIAAVQGGGLIRVSILQPEPVGRRYPVTDLLAPWRPDGAEVMVADGDLAALDSALDKSGFWDAAERGLKLPSDGFYWIAVVCRAGAVKFNAWVWPSERFERLVFPAVLERIDQSAIPKRQPRDDSRYQIIPRTLSARREETGLLYYDLTVGDNGLKDTVSLF